MNDTVKTVTIKNPYGSDPATIIINESDFDPALHKKAGKHHEEPDEGAKNDAEAEKPKGRGKGAH